MTGPATALRPVLCRFSDAGNDDLTICSGGRRPEEHLGFWIDEAAKIRCERGGNRVARGAAIPPSTISPRANGIGRGAGSPETDGSLHILHYPSNDFAFALH